MNHSLRMSETDPSSQSFYSGALPRISRFMIVLAFVSSLAAWPLFGWRVMLGVAFGCALCYLNFHCLKRVLTILADRRSPDEPRRPTQVIVLLSLLRRCLIDTA